MKEIFESTIENVSSMRVEGYENPVERTHNLEIWAKSGDQEYLYKFQGPGVRNANLVFGRIDDIVKKNEKLNKKIKKLEQKKSNLPETPITDAMLVDDYNRLTKENEELKKENEEFGNQILEYIEMNNRLREENKKLEELKTPTIENFADEKPSTRADILDRAKECVCGQREQDYGTPESNFQLIADLWNQYLFKEPGAKEIFGIGPMDVSMMMALMKIARIRNGGGSGDSFVDLAGYAACGGEIWHGERHDNA